MKIESKIFLILLAVAISCKEDDAIQDPIYEFISFKEEGPVNVNELANSSEGYPVVIQLWAFEPYNENITLQYTVTGSNATAGVDFTVTPAGSITLSAGKLTSDTIWIKTIDNASGAANDRAFDISLTSVSKSDIKIGLGLADPRQKTLTFNILDDECSLTSAIYSAPLTNLIGIDGSTQGTNAATGVVVGNTVSVTGDLIWYGPMDEPFKLTLVPDAVGSTKGNVTFGSQFMGTANDGYEYTFTQVGTGTFDVCSGTISITYDTSYRAVGDTDWTPWQRVTNFFELP
ncbi:MAG TPA: hypothetical protein VK508_15320 [Cyclobacteriaceae bacterium]|nr:hypothetical protein [Cyclobacteriaceae bacterium]